MALRRLAALGLVLGTVARAPAIDITECGQAVFRGQVGQLRNDLDCHASGIESALGVTLQRGGTLEMNGFTIRGDGGGMGIVASGRARDQIAINGPGEITDVDIGIAGGGARVRIRDVVAHHNTYGFTFKVSRRIEMTRVTMNDNVYGITANGAHLIGVDVEASHNTDVGIWVNGIGSLTRLTAVGNGGSGVSWTRRLRIVDSTITGNDGLDAGFDVLTTGTVKLVNSTCERGARIRSDYVTHTSTVIGRLSCASDPR